MLRYAVVLVLALLAACSTREEWEVACRGYGFTPGTDGFATCVQQQAMAERSR